MSEIKSVHRVYFHILDYKVKPKALIERAETALTEPPYYKGKGFAFRFPFTKKALVLGYWIGEATTLLGVFGGREVPLEELDVWETVRFGEHDVEEKTTA